MLKATLTPMQRFTVLNCLSFGPWRLTGPDDRPAGAPRLEDEELRRHWLEWAKFERGPNGRRDWTEGDWAVRRFELGESAERAFKQCRRLQRKEWAAEDQQR